MDMKKSKKLLALLAAGYWLLVVMIYLVANEQFHFSKLTGEALSPSAIVGEVGDGAVIQQRITMSADQLDSIEILAGTYARENTGTMQLTFADHMGTVVAQKEVSVSDFKDGQYTLIELDTPVEVQRNTDLLLTIETTGCSQGNAITLYCGNTVNTGRAVVEKSLSAEEVFTVNGELGMGKLCIKVNGTQPLTAYKWYWTLVTAAFAAAAGCCMYWWKLAQRGRNNPLVMVCTMLTRYGFLIKQLVGRDFKTKYKRSVLGMAWSFLNPLLTMSVQYVVFSTLFKSDIPNYSVYLLSGLVFFNFFSEAVSMGMTSITGNASLIKKVYMPKYIYPVSRVISSLVNFVLAIIPLFLMMLVTGVQFSPALLLLVFDVICLLGFVTGMGLLLTTAMTFFQDTQFLWGVVSMMWMYLTPIFYPESIIDKAYLGVYRMNPMYQYITFARTCILDGVSPAPAAYLWCLGSALAVLLLGILVFRKNQDKFVLYL